jgi:hypothetical protein
MQFERGEQFVVSSSSLLSILARNERIKLFAFGVMSAEILFDVVASFLVIASSSKKNSDDDGMSAFHSNKQSKCAP